MILQLTILWACRQQPTEAPKPPPRDPRQHVLPEKVVSKTLFLPYYGNTPVYHPVPVSGAKGLVMVLTDTPSTLVEQLSSEAVVLELSTRMLRRRGEVARDRCWYPADDLEMLSQSTEKILGFATYQRPILVADGSAAAIAYLAVAQAPSETFAGLAATDFRLKLDFVSPFCGHGNWEAAPDLRGTISLQPRTELAPRTDGGPRVRLGAASGVDLTNFLASMPAAAALQPSELVPTVRAWLNPTAETFPDGDVGPASLANLKLPLRVTWPENPRAILVMLSDAGGWSEEEKAIATALKEKQVATVGWDSLSYFWQNRSPGALVGDIALLMRAMPSEIPVWAGGLNFGAEVLATSITRLDTDSSTRLTGMVLVSPGRTATLQLSPSTPGSPVAGSWPVETWRLAETRPVLCIHPAGDEGNACVRLKVPPPAPPPAKKGKKKEEEVLPPPPPDPTPPPLLKVAALEGGRNFGGNWESISNEILAMILPSTPEEPPKEEVAKP
jgi:type IV secretory pathway VirJ component